MRFIFPMLINILGLVSALALGKEGHTKFVSYQDDAPPFTAEMKGHFVVDPDLALTIVHQYLSENSEFDESNEDQYTRGLIQALNARMSYVNVNAKKYRNQYHGVIGDIFVLFATPWEYMILFKFKERESQQGVGFWEQLDETNQKLIDELGLGFSGRYLGTEFRTIPLSAPQVTLVEDGSVHTHQPGDRAFLSKGAAKFYRSGWILECAHGKLYQALPRFFWENRIGDIFGQFGAVLHGLVMSHKYRQ